MGRDSRDTLERIYLETQKAMEGDFEVPEVDRKEVCLFAA